MHNNNKNTREKFVRYDSVKFLSIYVKLLT